MLNCDLSILRVVLILDKMNMFKFLHIKYYIVSAMHTFALKPIIGAEKRRKSCLLPH